MIILALVLVVLGIAGIGPKITIEQSRYINVPAPKFNLGELGPFEK